MKKRLLLALLLAVAAAALIFAQESSSATAWTCKGAGTYGPVLDGNGVVIDAACGMHYLTVIVEDGGTATISRVDSPTASVHTDSQSFVAAVGSEDFDVFLIDWPYYRVSLAGGDARVAVVP